MWTTLCTGISLIGSGVQAGALLMVLFGVCPTFRSLDVPDWMRVHSSLDRSIERFMPAVNQVTAAATLVLLFLPQTGPDRTLRILALVCNLGLAGLSWIDVRLNKIIAGKVAAFAGTVPGPGLDLAEMEEIRERWIFWHGQRTLVMTLGFVLYAAAVLN